MENDIFIGIATQKKLEMNFDDCYKPIIVGADCHNIKIDNYCEDNNGLNISKFNTMFCELTALYWMRHNVEAQYYGLVHYRRFFGKKNPLTFLEISEYLKKNDVILPKKRSYYVESLYSHYSHTHYAIHLEVTREIISSLCPSYLTEFDKLKKRKSAHMFNMLIMKKGLFHSYCDWLFPILFELEKRIDVSNYDSFQKRYLGRISELLFDVWLNFNKIKYSEVKVFFAGKSNVVKKIIRFLKSFILRRKYEKSA